MVRLDILKICFHANLNGVNAQLTENEEALLSGGHPWNVQGTSKPAAKVLKFTKDSDQDAGDRLNLGEGETQDVEGDSFEHMLALASPIEHSTFRWSSNLSFQAH